MSLSISQTSTETITNIVFGIFAVVIGAVTIWQGYRAWNIWRCHHRVQQPNALGELYSVGFTYLYEPSLLNDPS